MVIVCPYCQHESKSKTPKPGRYGANCAKCSRPFRLVMPEDASQPVVIWAAVTEPAAAKAAPDSARASQQATDPTATAPFEAGTATQAFQSAAPQRPADVDPTTTAAYDSGAGDDATRTAAYQGAGEDATSTAAYASAPPTQAFAGDATDAARGDATARSAASADKPAAPPSDMPERLGGYQVLQELGRGGMGAVYLGRQISLDRKVALKVMNPQWGNDPTFVARFIREAYAAAQLVHHNVVQIYDIGTDHDVHYFSMEFVKGQALQGLVKKQGKLDVELAVNYVLQAARGLKFAHDQGMIHRDVKPDNLMLNDQGVVKVADLGLVKVPDAPDAPASESASQASGPLSGSIHVTRAGSMMGTPAFMAPEQAKDAANVDVRADIYSLGCTLYVLVTGRLPFEGKTVPEILSKHATTPVVPPDTIVKRVPKELSAILLKMMAKRPEDRYASLGEVIEALEKLLGIQSVGQFSPSEQHASTLEDCVKKFNESPKAKLRSLLLPGVVGACTLLTLACLFLGPFWLTGGLFGLSVLTPFTYFVVSGFRERTALFSKFRELVWGSSWSDMLTWLGGGLLFLLALFLAGFLWAWIAASVIAVLLGAGLHFWLDRGVAAERAGPLEAAEKLFKSMRLKGIEEAVLQQFVCKYSGKQWEEFYEAIFGYEAKIAARNSLRGDVSGRREKFRAWREPVINWIDASQQARREAREKKHLQAIEQKSLQASGLDAAAAKKKAAQTAAAMVKQASAIRSEIASGSISTTSRASRRSMQARLEEAIKQEEARAAKAGRSSGLVGSLVGMLLGPKVRFLAAAVLLAGFLAWIYQNKSQQLTEIAKQAVESKDVSSVSGLEAKLGGKMEPLSLPLVPGWLTGLFDNYNPGVAGLLLLVSAFFRGWRISLFAFPGAAVLFLGHRFGIPAAGPVAAEYVAMAAGAALFLVGFFLGRQKKTA